MIEEAKRTKKTRRTGKRCGMKSRSVISIAINDSDRNVSRMCEFLKKHYSRKRITASEAYRTVFLRGLVAVLEEWDIEAAKLEEQEREERQQMRLFE